MLIMVVDMAEVDVTREGAVLTITLNRPDVLNALNAAVHAALFAALEEAKDPAVRAVVITGAGRGFCVGQDLQEFKAGAGDVAGNLRRNYHRNVLAIRALEKPVIAAVNGPAAGAGLSLALACDIRIASDAASFVPAFINIGLVPDSGGTWMARRLLGTPRALEWLTTGRKLSADEARAMGIVSEIVAAAEFEERTHEVGTYFATMPTRAFWHTKRLLDVAETTTFAQQLELEAAAQAEQTKTDDFHEGVAAFLEKREAVFTGAPLTTSAPAGTHPVSLVVTDDLRRTRLTVFFRWFLALLPLLVVALWSIAALVVAIAAWFTALVNGRLPDGMHRWLAAFLRYAVQVEAYLVLAADPFPGFGPEAYPVDLVVAGAGEQPRWTVAFRLPLIVPAYLFAIALGYVATLVSFLVWFAALATGQAPRGMRDLLVYATRYRAQTFAYLLLLTSTYPTLASEL
jgi:2-(1,2-epoxy-1,2-dihydrophenyl)acetyl-CoA isomerase